MLLAGAAAFLAIGIWSMHFIVMLADADPGRTPSGWPGASSTIISFLICALVVGISLFFVSIGEPSLPRVASSAVLLGVGIASMHYVGIHGLAGNFAIVHDQSMVLLSIVIAIVAAYGGLRAFLARQEGIRLIASSIAFGVAVSGMHYTAMYGMHFVPLTDGAHHHIGGGLAASQQALSLVVAMLCFVIAAGFLLSLVPDPRRQAMTTAAVDPVAELTLMTAPGSLAEAEPGQAMVITAAEARAARRSRPAAAPPSRRCRGFRSKAPTARISSIPPTSGASGPTRITRAFMTAPASGCARGRSRKPKRNSIPACSSGCIAATSSRSRMSVSCAGKATAR